MSSTYPLPRSNRSSDFVASLGQQVFGPTQWLCLDPEDIEVLVRVSPSQRMKRITSGFSIQASQLPGPVSVRFHDAQLLGQEVRIRSKRVHRRVTDVTRASALQSANLERELDLVTTVLQEQRRDIDELETSLASSVVAVPISEQINPLPLAPGRAGKVFGFDGEGQPIMLASNTVNTLPASNISDSTAAGRAIITGTDTALRTLAGRGLDALVDLPNVNVPIEVNTITLAGYAASGDVPKFNVVRSGPPAVPHATSETVLRGSFRTIPGPTIIALVAVLGGLTGAAAPAWTGVGTTINDGAVKWAVIDHSHAYAGFLQSADGAWWRLSDRDHALPQWFGAKADGATNDGPTINLAIAYLRRQSYTAANGYNHSGGHLYFPKANDGGYYRSDDVLDIRDITNLKISGVGSSRWNGFTIPASSIVYHGSAPVFCITNFANERFNGACGTESLSLESVAIMYSPTSSFTGTLVNSKGIGFSAYDCRFAGYDLSSTSTQNAFAAVALRQHSYVFENCSFTSVKRGIYLPTPVGGDGNANGLRVINCQFYDCSEAAIDSPGGTTGAIITGSVFNALLLRTPGNFAKTAIRGRFTGAVIQGNSFLPTDASIAGWSDAALKIEGGSGNITGNAFVQWLGVAIDIAAGNWGISNNEIVGPCPIMIRAGKVQLGTNSLGCSVNVPNVYSYGTDRSRAYAVGEYVKPVGSGNLVLRCTTSGITGATAPAWPSADTDVGAFIPDGTVIWKVMPLASIQFATMGFEGGFSGTVADQAPYIAEQQPGWLLYAPDGGPFDGYAVKVIYDEFTDISVNGPRGGGYLSFEALQNAPVNLATSQGINPKKTGRTINNSGATGAVTYTLPSGNTAVGLSYTFVQLSGQELNIAATAGMFIRRFGSSGGDATVTCASGAANLDARIEVRAVSNSYWEVREIQGTWS